MVAEAQAQHTGFAEEGANSQRAERGDAAAGGLVMPFGLLTDDD